MPASLHVVDTNEKNYIDIKIDIIAGHGTFNVDEPEADSPICDWEIAETGCMEGEVRLRDGSLGLLERPKTLACLVAPEHVGRIDASVALQIRLACLGLGWRKGRVRCRENDIELQMNAEVVSRWHHWYSDWQPSNFNQLESEISSMTTVRRPWLQEHVNSSGLSLAILAKIQVGIREQTYDNLSIDVDQFLIRPQESETLAFELTSNGG